MAFISTTKWFTHAKPRLKVAQLVNSSIIPLRVWW
jgi:hypothetical protein